MSHNTRLALRLVRNAIVAVCVAGALWLLFAFTARLYLEWKGVPPLPLKHVVSERETMGALSIVIEDAVEAAGALKPEAASWRDDEGVLTGRLRPLAMAALDTITEAHYDLQRGTLLLGIETMQARYHNNAVEVDVTFPALLFPSGRDAPVGTSELPRERLRSLPSVTYRVIVGRRMSHVFPISRDH